MLAVIPVRDGVAPAGAAETVAECAGRALVVGPGGDADVAAGLLATDVRLLDPGPYAPGRWAAALAAVLRPPGAPGAPGVAGAPAAEPAGAGADAPGDDDVVVLPASPDGRDLAPRLAHALGRPLLAGAIEVTPTSARLARDAGRFVHDVAVSGPVVATLQPGVRGVDTADPPADRPVRVTELGPLGTGDDGVRADAVDATVVEVLPADVATMDLAEATRIFAGGAGLDGPARIRQLAAVAGALGAATGATRVVSDRGWIGHQRQIGTTGVTVDPELYVAFGVSGAVQHTAGLGTPAHIVSVNTDPHCPMMHMADVAIVADANAVLDELARLTIGPAVATDG